MTTPPVARFDERRQRIEVADVSDEYRRYAMAFCTFDELTDPDAVKAASADGPRLRDTIVRFTQLLVQRTLERAAHALAGLEFAPGPVDDRTRDDAIVVEAMFRDALCRAFPAVPGTKTFPIRTFEKAFAAFVGGELRTGRISPLAGATADRLAIDGAPDGANQLCFAEAALLFVRAGLNASFWRPLLRSFVGTTPFFTAIYWDRSRRAWGAYRCEHQRLVVPAAVILAVVDQVHAGMDVARLARHFGELVGLALRQDHRLPQPAPAAKEFA